MGEVEVHRAQGSGGGASAFDPFRRVILAGTVTFLALAGHAAGQGSLPGTVGVALVVILATALTFAACARSRSVAWLVAYLIATQSLIHVVLVLASPHGHAAGPPSLIPTDHMAMSHLAAAVIAAVVLARGEGTLEAWGRLLSACLNWAAPEVPGPPSRPALCIESGQRARTISNLSFAIHRRGPPVTSFA